MRTCLAIAALTLAACDDRHHLYESETTTTFVDGRPTTTLFVHAWTAWGGHESGEREPHEGLDLYGGPSPGDLRRLVEGPPGRYTAILDGAAPAYRYRIEGDDHVHAAATMYTAAVTTSAAERTAVVTWDPPLVDQLFGQSITIGQGETDGYLYSWADVEIVRELTFDMP